MKRTLYLIMLPVILLVASCQKTEYVVPNRTILTTIQPGSWISSNNGRTSKAAISVPEINTDFNEYGGVLVFISFGTVEYEAIPQVYNGISYRYTTAPLQIVITIENSDGLGTVLPPGDPMDVKIILVDSN
ncbi:hypothetical protein [Rubrolithibacter danxiaensis]|uniref:hypothetical protein n=1 Tax=Rubrolithibacter danxiaensis TaxID=3390805 RepID=UPI003BF7C04D